MRFWHTSAAISFHSTSTLSHSSCTPFGEVGYLCKALLRCTQRCSIGLMSGDWEGQTSTWMSLSSNHCEAFLEVCLVSQAKPVPSHTQANACTSPTVPALKPSYSQVTRLGIRAHDPGKQHVTETRDRPRDLQVLWGSRDPGARDPVKETGDLSRDWSATRSGDYRYMTRPLNHPVGTTNGGVRINKVV